MAIESPSKPSDWRKSENQSLRIISVDASSSNFKSHYSNVKHYAITRGYINQLRFPIIALSYSANQRFSNELTVKAANILC